VNYLYKILKILNPILPIDENEINESISHLKRLKKIISTDNLSSNNPSIYLANWINGIPMIYYPWGLQTAAIRFKNSLQENAKVHAMTEDVIEACHNGIVSWERKSNVKPILIQGEDDFIKTKERWKILKDYFDDENIQFYEVYSIKGNILSKLINLIYLFDFASIYKALQTQKMN